MRFGSTYRLSLLADAGIRWGRFEEAAAALAEARADHLIGAEGLAAEAAADQTPSFRAHQHGVRSARHPHLGGAAPGAAEEEPRFIPSSITAYRDQT